MPNQAKTKRLTGKRAIEPQISDTTLEYQKGGPPGPNREPAVFRLLPKVQNVREVTSPFDQSAWVHNFILAGQLGMRTLRGYFWDKDPRRPVPEGEEHAEKLPEEHELHRLIRRPNPFCTEAEMWGSGYANRILTGEDFWILTDDDDKGVTELKAPGVEDSGGSDGFFSGATEPGKIPLPTRIWNVGGASAQLLEQSVARKRGGEARMTPVGWQIDWDEQPRDFDFQSVVQFKLYDPASRMRGIGPIQTLKGELDLELRAKQAQAGFFDNGGTPGVFIKKKSQLSTEAYDQLRAEMRRVYKDPGNRGLPVVIDDADDVEIQFSPARAGDLAFPETYKDLRQKISGATRIPETMVGVMDRAILNNFKVSEQIMWRNALLPDMLLIEDVINNRLLRRLDGFEGVVFRFDLSEVKGLQEDEAEVVVKAGQLHRDVPHVSYHEALGQFGLERPEVEEGDRRFAPSGLVSLEDFDNPPEPVEPVAAPGDEEEPPTDPPADEDDDEPEKAAELVVQSYLVEYSAFADESAAQEWAGRACVPWLPEKAEGGWKLEQRPAAAFVAETLEVVPRTVDGGVVVLMGQLKPGQCPAALLMLGLAGAEERFRAETLEATADELATKAGEDVAPTVDELRREAAWKKIANNVLARSEDRFQVKFRKFDKSMAAAQLKRLQDIADGKDADASSRLDAAQAAAVKVGPDSDQIAAAILNGVDLDFLLLNEAAWKTRGVNAFLPILEEIFKLAAKDAALELGVDAVVIDAAHARAIAALETQVFKMVDHTHGTIRERVRRSLLEEFHKSSSIGTMREHVEELLPNLKGSVVESFKDRTLRGQRIARTETATATNTARILTFELNGTTRHEWISSRDAAVRDTHGTGPSGLDGEIRALGEEFKPGLTRPGDQNAAPEERINCRCMTLPVSEEPVPFGDINLDDEG